MIFPFVVMYNWWYTSCEKFRTLSRHFLSVAENYALLFRSHASHLECRPPSDLRPRMWDAVGMPIRGPLIDQCDSPHNAATKPRAILEPRYEQRKQKDVRGVRSLDVLLFTEVHTFLTTTRTIFPGLYHYSLSDSFVQPYPTIRTTSWLVLITIHNELLLSPNL